MNVLKSILMDISEQSYKRSIECSPAKSGRGLKSLRTARNFSSLYYDGSESIKEITREFIAKKFRSNNNSAHICDRDVFCIEEFTLELLHSSDPLREVIVESIESESVILEQQIRKLNTAMESQTDTERLSIAVPSPSPSSVELISSNISMETPKIICEYCAAKGSALVLRVKATKIDCGPLGGKGKKLIDGSEAPLIKSTTGLSATALTKVHMKGVESICSVCCIAVKRLQQCADGTDTPYQRMEGDHWVAIQSQRGTGSNLEDSPSSYSSFSGPTEASRPLSSRGGSKFRTRLNIARDELHFFEDF